MKAAAMALVFLSSMALAQTSQTEAEADCIACREQARSQEPVQISREMNQIFDQVRTSSKIPGARKIIELTAHEVSSNTTQETRDASLNSSKYDHRKTFSVAVDSADAFDQQTADELARAMKVRGFEDSTVIDIYMLRERDEAQRSEVMARLRKALKIVLNPVVKDVRGKVIELKNQKKPESQSSTNIDSEGESKDEAKVEKKDFKITSNLVDSFRYSGTTIVMQVFGNSDPQHTRTLEVVKDRGASPRLELRLSKSEMGRLNYGVAANAGRENGHGAGSVFFYVGCAIDSHFQCSK